jgi:hypothetical protein
MLASDLDIVAKILHELYVSEIGFSIGSTPGNGIEVQLFDPLHGIVAAESFTNGIVAAIEWLRDAAYDYYHDTVFADGELGATDC